MSAEGRHFEYPGSPTELVALFRDYYGPTMNAYAAAEASGRTEELHEELHEELVALFTSHNRSEDPDRTSIPATFLKVSVHV